MNDADTKLISGPTLNKKVMIPGPLAARMPVLKPSRKAQALIASDLKKKDEPENIKLNELARFEQLMKEEEENV